MPGRRSTGIISPLSSRNAKLTQLMKLSTVNVPTLDHGAIDAIVGAYHGDPFAILGMHQVGDHLVVRIFRPEARAVSIQDLRDGGQRYPGVQVHGDGFFEVIVEN